MSAENLSGQTLKTYRIMERIGAGGYGAVYRAIQTGIEREVAIKVILPEHANHPDFIRRFEIEAQLVARLEHPHIVPLYDYWREPNTAVLVMRFLRGGSLRQGLSRAETGWSVKQVAGMLVQISSALMFAHASGVVHRDLKTDNILLDEHGNCYLGDFGIAKDMGGNLNLTRDAILGTPAYLAPEQIRGEAVTAASDIYALGIVAYEALTNTRPFYDVTPATILFKQLHDALPDVTDIRPDVPPALNVVLQRATAKEVSARYETALDFALDFQRVVQEAGGDIGLATREMITLGGPEEDGLLTGKNPYKGLRAFQQADAADFFGRGHLVDRLVKRLKDSDEGANFLAVVGPSGSGKSSVVKAGLLPALQRGILDETLDWYLIDMIPGTHPLEELEAALLSIAPAEIPSLLQLLKEDSRGFVRAVRRILPGENARLILTIDQFEELFTLVNSEAARLHFMDSLIEAVNDPRSRVKVIITLRADFYDRPLLYERFGDLMRRRTELVLPMSNEELDQAIVGPAHRVGAVFEPGLTQAIINEVKQQPGALPLLQYALTELFERREGRRLTVKAYREIGGTSGALARRADEVYNNFDETTKDAARQMFLRLVIPGEGTEDTRRRALQSELLTITGAASMQKVIDAFGKYRLLTFDHDPQTRSATVEVAHEALIRQWQRMRDWLDESREAVRLQRRLLAAAEEWQRSDKDPSFLARGLQLEQFELQAVSGGVALNVLEAEYLKASTAARDAHLAAERARQEREALLEKRARDRLRILAAVMGISAVIGIVLSIFAFNQRDAAAAAQQLAEANEQEALARGTEVAVQAALAQKNADEASSLALAANARNAFVEGNMPLSLALAMEAANAFTPPPVEVRRMLAGAVYAPGVRFRMTGASGSVVAVEFSADGKRMLAGSADGTITVRDAATGATTLKIATGQRVIAASFSPDGMLIAAALADMTMRLYNSHTGEELRSFSGHEAGILDIDFSDDGQFLASGAEDRTVRLWDVSSGELLKTFSGSPGALLRVAFAPDGKTIASSSADATILNDATDTVDRTIRLWDVETGETRLVIEPKSGFVRSLDFSPDGTTLATGVWDSANAGTIRIYDGNTGEEINRLFARSDIITDIHYSPDGRYIALVSWDSVVQVWDIARRWQVHRFIGFADRILSMDYSADGQFLVIGTGNTGNNEFVERARDTSVWLIDLKNRDEIRSFNGYQDWVWTVDLSLDGTLAATAGGPLRLPQAQQGQPAPAMDTSIRLWKVASGEEVAQLNGHTNTVDSVKFLPDGKRLVSGSWDGLIILWDITTGEQLRVYEGHTGRVYKLALSADGSRFLSASADGTVKLWDTETGAMIREFNHRAAPDETTEINGVDFNPDETRFVTGASDRKVRVWDVHTGDVLLTLQGHTDTVNETIYSPDGTLIASSSWDDSIHLWDAATGEPVRTITGHAGNTFGLAFTADSTALLTTSQDMTVRLWEVATGEELHRYPGHTDWIQEVIISADETFAISGAQDRTVRVWRLDREPEALMAFAEQNRYVRELTCDERARYRLKLCGDD